LKPQVSPAPSAQQTVAGVLQYPPDAYQVYKKKLEEEPTIVKPATGFFKNVFYDFQEFMFANNVLVIATGWGIGTATKEIIDRLLTDVLMPLLSAMGKFSLTRHAYNFALKHAAETRMEPVLIAIGNIAWDFTKWLTVIALTFILLEYVLNRRIIGLSTTVRQEAKAEFAKAKASAATEKIIPDDKDLEVLEKRIMFDKETGEQMIDNEKQVIQQAVSAVPSKAAQTATPAPNQAPNVAPMFNYYSYGQQYYAAAPVATQAAATIRAAR
jgi:large-conductance mechanosensitive channel